MEFYVLNYFSYLCAILVFSHSHLITSWFWLQWLSVTSQSGSWVTVWATFPRVSSESFLMSFLSQGQEKDLVGPLEFGLSPWLWVMIYFLAQWWGLANRILSYSLLKILYTSFPCSQVLGVVPLFPGSYVVVSSVCLVLHASMFSGKQCKSVVVASEGSCHPVLGVEGAECGQLSVTEGFLTPENPWLWGAAGACCCLVSLTCLYST